MNQLKSGLDSVNLPENLQTLRILSGNLHWTWNRKIRRVLETTDSEGWEKTFHNPVLVMQKLSQQRIQELSKDQSFLEDLAIAYDTHKEYMIGKNTWFQRTYGGLNTNHLVAYFSAEFGITSCLRTYSGGLGMLAGDHLKSASDLGIPLVGVGLFYKKGYFAQTLSHDGWQIESYPENKPDCLMIEPVFEKDSFEPLLIYVPVADRQVAARAWRVSVGRVFLYLLDTNVPEENSSSDCEITSELYGGDSDLRIKQEIILGFGGAILLRELGIEPTIYHMNEGHCAFVGLELIRALVEETHGTSLHDALEKVKPQILFTTHTPVAAGIDIFSRDQIEAYLSFLPKQLGIHPQDIFALGQESPDSGQFNMAVLAIHLSRDVNAVSKLHRDVARKLWRHVLREDDGSRKIGSVTNGIHIPSWISDSMADLYDLYLGEEWMENLNDPETWRKISEIPEGLFWEIRCKERARLVDYLKPRIKHDHHGDLDSSALTIGFARRFATYKRATLLFTDSGRLERLVSDNERPIQFVFSGKAHPRDNDGKRLIQEIYNFSKREHVHGKIVFLGDYDISIARNLVQGVDLWLNNPRRPLEASGTSGMKVLANGGLNFGVLDGWWDEAYTPSNGWAIGSGLELGHHHEQDKMDAESLYKTLESQIIPDFYQRTEGIPLRWVQKMKNSIRTLSPVFNTRRMVIEYAQRFYFKSVELGKSDDKTENNHEK